MALHTFKDGVLLNAKGRPVNMSPSSYDKWSACKRSWYYAYLERIETPPSPSAAIGIRVHDMLENWVRYGAVPGVEDAEVYDPMTKTKVVRQVDKSKSAEWAMAQAVIPYLPEVVEGHGVVGNWDAELEIKNINCGPLPFVGKVDLSNLVDFDHWKIDDYKTTSSTSFRWSKTTDEALRNTDQPQVYAYGLWRLLNEVDGRSAPERVNFRHFNIATKTVTDDRTGETRYPVQVAEAQNVAWSQIETTWERFVMSAEAQYKLAETANCAEDVEPDTSACKNYGGCPFADRCPSSPVNRDNRSQEAYTMSASSAAAERRAALQAQLRGMKSGGSAPAEAPKPQNNVKTADLQEVADKLRGLVEKPGSKVKEAAIKMMAASIKVDLGDLLEAAGCQIVGGMVEVKGGSAPAEPRKSQIEDLVEAIEKSESLLMAFISLASEGHSDNKVLQKMGLVGSDGTPTEKARLVAEAMGLEIADPDLGDDIDEVEDEVEVEVEVEVEDEDEVEDEVEDDTLLPPVQQALYDAAVANGGFLSRDQVNDAIKSADPTALRVRIQRAIEECKKVPGATVTRDGTLSLDTIRKGQAPVVIKPAVAKVEPTKPAVAKTTQNIPERDDVLGRNSDELSAMSVKYDVAAGYILETHGLVMKYGMALPKDFKGSVLEATRQFAPHKAKKAERVEEIAEGLTQALENPKSDEDVEVEAKAAQAPVRNKDAEGTKEVTKAPTKAPKATDVPSDRVWLFVDCAPVSHFETPQDLARLIQEEERAVEEAGGKVAGKFFERVPYYGLIDYAEGSKRVIARVAERVAKEGVGAAYGTCLRLSGNHPLADMLIAVLLRDENVTLIRAAR